MHVESSKDNFRDQVRSFTFWGLRIELLVGLVASTLTHLSHLPGLTDVNLWLVRVDDISLFLTTSI